MDICKHNLKKEEFFYFVECLLTVRQCSWATGIDVKVKNPLVILNVLSIHFVCPFMIRQMKRISCLVGDL